MSKRILIIDDEENIRRVTRFTLQAAGYEVGEASDGQSGLELFGDGSNWEAVLLDQRIINQATDIGAAALALHHRLARESLVQKAKAAGLHVAVWTVDDPAWIERARAIGIDALITNDPATMLQARR